MGRVSEAGKREHLRERRNMENTPDKAKLGSGHTIEEGDKIAIRQGSSPLSCYDTRVLAITQKKVVLKHLDEQIRAREGDSMTVSREAIAEWLVNGEAVLNPPER